MSFTEEQGLAAVRHMQNRASCRNFAGRPIADDVLDELLTAGIRAATGGNLQPYSILVERDRAKCAELCRLCGNQAFIEKAAVNLIFLLDWHKYSVYTRDKKAPFTCDRAYMHYLIGVEDLMCAAQTIETAAYLMGIGSCYVGSINDCGREVAELYRLPQRVYPMVMLSLGYPAAGPARRPKLDKSAVVFEGEYPWSDRQIIADFDRKYQGQFTPLPPDGPYRAQMLDNLRRALLTTYSADETEEILRAARQEGRINETQRRFGLHYHAEDQMTEGRKIIAAMGERGLHPFA